MYMHVHVCARSHLYQLCVLLNIQFTKVLYCLS